MTTPLPGVVERDRAIDAARAGANFEWYDQAFLVVEDIARTQPELTTDDVWSRLYRAGEPRALGAVMRDAQREGVIEPTDNYRPSTRPQCHRRPVRVWKSRRFVG